MLMDKSLSTLRHDARGCLNAIKLCISALDLPCTFEENMEFIDDVILSADRLDGLLEKIAAHFDDSGQSEL
jgi:hypothetical protein